MSDDPTVRLREALARNDLQAVRAALDDGADIHAFAADGDAPLHCAVWIVKHQPDSELLELLLSRGADPNASAAPDSANAFEFAVMTREVRLARRLLEAGATITPTARKKASAEPEMLALLEQWPIHGSTANEPDKQLMLAAHAGDLEAVTTLLRAGADPTARDAAGATALDHAASKRHASVVFALERAEAGRDANAALFLAALDDTIGGVLTAADTIDLGSRDRRGRTALMLAARYGRQFALKTLLSVHAPIDPRNGAATALVYAIEAGDLACTRLLLDHGAALNFDVDGRNPVLDAACEQSDSDLLKLLLMRGLDVSPYPNAWALDRESARMLRNARAGVLPIAGPPSFSPWSKCSVCRELPDAIGWCISASGEQTGAPFPVITEQFETIEELWKCPWCGTHYRHEHDHDNGIPDGWDSEDLRRISLERAREVLRAMAPTPHIERELAALNAAIAFDEAVASPGRKVQVSDEEVSDGARALMIFSLASDGAKLLAARNVREHDHDAIVADLKARGCAVAETDASCDLVWVRDTDGVEVHSSRRKLLHAAGDRATLLSGESFAREDIVQVIAFAEGYEDRGIKVMLRSGEQLVLVTDPGSAPSDPCYTRNELLWETGWCSTLGRAIAQWAGTGFEDLI